MKEKKYIILVCISKWLYLKFTYSGKIFRQFTARVCVYVYAVSVSI